LWAGETWTLSEISYEPNGYVEEYSKYHTICNSWILMDGMNLAPRWITITIFVVMFFWLTLGIMIAVDYFM
jgi:hypothetical protein